MELTSSHILKARHTTVITVIIIAVVIIIMIDLDVCSKVHATEGRAKEDRHEGHSTD